MHAVEVEPVAGHRVGKRGVRGRFVLVLADDHGVANVAELTHRRRALGGNARRAHGQASARVEQLVFCAVHDVARDGVGGKRCYKRRDDSTAVVILISFSLP